jgi:hypothetical protein
MTIAQFDWPREVTARPNRLAHHEGELEKDSSDHAKVNFLAATSDRLSEIERLLANRPPPRPAEVRDERNATPKIYDSESP